MGNYCRYEVETESSMGEKSTFTPVDRQPLTKSRDKVISFSLGSETTKSRNNDLLKRKKIEAMKKPSPKIFTVRRPEFAKPIYDPILAEKYKKVPVMGPIHLEDKSTYEGQLKKKLRYGFGEWVTANGSMYEGYWDNDKRNGIGRFFFANGHVYDGVWANDMMNGQGRLYVAENEYYEGSFQNGCKSGLGKYFLPDGSYYEGTWKQDKRVGEGWYYDSSTKKKTFQIWSLDSTHFS